ncbi:MAG: hypothetical protein M3285_05070 [Actinomycetota bacterium]|nr:hypothetical protein [Actinomycetota bacterium]
MRTLRVSRLHVVLGIAAAVAALSLTASSPVEAHEGHKRAGCSARWTKAECSFIYPGGDVQLGAWSKIGPNDVVEPGIVRLERAGPIPGTRRVLFSCVTVMGGCAAATAGANFAPPGTKMFCAFDGEGTGGRYYCRAYPQ